MPQYDVRADKWGIAQNAMDRVNRERIAKGQQPPSEEVNKKDTAQGDGYRDWETDRKSTRLNSSHITRSRMPSSA